MLSPDNSYQDLVHSISQNTKLRILLHFSKEVLIKLEMLSCEKINLWSTPTWGRLDSFILDYWSFLSLIFFSHFLLQIFFKCILHNFYAFFFVFNLILSQKDRSHYFILNLLLANKIFDTGAAWYSYSNHWNALEISKGYFIYTFSLPEKRSIENTMYGNENNPTLSQIVAKYIKVSPYSLAEKKCSTSANACVMHPSWRHTSVKHASCSRHVFVKLESSSPFSCWPWP